MSTDQGVDRASVGTDRGSLCLAATLLLAGQILFIVVTQFHTGGDANDHPSIFTKHAGSGDWKGGACAPVLGRRDHRRRTGCLVLRSRVSRLGHGVGRAYRRNARGRVTCVVRGSAGG
jgi:hypothetical protein